MLYKQALYIRHLYCLCLQPYIILVSDLMGELYEVYALPSASRVMSSSPTHMIVSRTVPSLLCSSVDFFYSHVYDIDCTRAPRRPIVILQTRTSRANSLLWYSSMKYIMIPLYIVHCGMLTYVASYTMSCFRYVIIRSSRALIILPCAQNNLCY